MALLISEIIEESDSSTDLIVAVEFKINFKKDGFMLQSVVRALAVANGSFESNFGFGEDFEEVLEFNYACKGAINRLVLERENGRTLYKHMIIKKGAKKSLQ